MMEAPLEDPANLRPPGAQLLGMIHHLMQNKRQ
jgi:hypothetical protein